MKFFGYEDQENKHGPLDEKIKSNPPNQQARAGACSSSISPTQFRALSWSGWMVHLMALMACGGRRDSQLGNHHFQVSY